MTTYLITRHTAAGKWVKNNLKESTDDLQIIPHVDDSFWANLTDKDVVIGTLPIHLAAKAVRITRHNFGFLTLTVPQELRGEELTLEQMDSCSPSIEWFYVEEM